MTASACVLSVGRLPRQGGADWPGILRTLGELYDRAPLFVFTIILSFVFVYLAVRLIGLAKVSLDATQRALGEIAAALHEIPKLAEEQRRLSLASVEITLIARAVHEEIKDLMRSSQARDQEIMLGIARIVDAVLTRTRAT